MSDTDTPMNVTAKVILFRKESQGSGDQEIVNLQFRADYEDGRNKEWSAFTPSLSLMMTVKPSVAELYYVNEAYTLTFEVNNDV